jgi:hypothetical protein
MRRQEMARKFLVVAGPQAAGKSTAILDISGSYGNSVPMLSRTRKGAELPHYGVQALEESRAIVVHKYGSKGAIFMSDLDEIEVIHNDMTRMFKIIRSEDRGEVYMDECNVFTLGHARAHGIDLLDGYYKQYCDMLHRLDARFLFLDVPPEVSWERRKGKYEQRHSDLPPDEKEKVLKKHKEYLSVLYPELLGIYDRLDFPKARISTDIPLPQALALAEKEISELIRC